MNGEAPTFGLRRGTVLCVAGGGYRAAMFHLGALTRLNELGLLAGTETICAVAGGSILASLLATRVPWPLQGAFREWPEEIAEPLHEICSSRGPRPGLRPTGAAQAEHYARELASQPEGRALRRPRLVFGAAGLELGRIAERQAGEREPGVQWELVRSRREAPEADPIAAAAAQVAVDLAPLEEGERALLANHGYRLADMALRAAGAPPAAIEPLPPQPPHPHWDNPRRAVAVGRRRPRRTRWIRGRREARGGPAREEASELLRRHRPFLRFDSLESYRPEPVTTIVELAVGSRCNTLHRADGELLASALPLAGAARLDLEYLDAPTYADGRPALPGDYLDEAGGSYAGDALLAGNRESHDEVVYGRAAWSGGRLWLQYWFFYYYDDKGFLGAGRHEGDWEMVQLRIGAEGEIDSATYGRHRLGERADRAELELHRDGADEAPVVYCARGSHASLLRPGTRPAPVVPDHNDGLGPLSRPRLIEIGEPAPGWLRWPGRWGSTRRREAFEGDSPRGPAQQPQWRRPAEFHDEAQPAGEAPRWTEPPPPTPYLEARREGNHAILSYSFAPATSGRSAPARIVAALIGGADGAVGVAHSFGIEGRGGACALPAAGRSATAIRACVASELGAPGPTLSVPIAG